MDDALLVRRAAGGDLDSFGQVYDRYFNRLYDFSWRILRDDAEAADVTQQVFAGAARNLSAAGRAPTVRAWLFGMAHATAVERADAAGTAAPAPSHEEAFGTFEVPDAVRVDEPELSAGDAELPSLVWEAATALNPRDYALLDLHLRQGLDATEIGHVMGVSKANATTMIARMKQVAGEVLGSYVLGRRGSSDCGGLQRVLEEHPLTPYTDDVRQAIDEHVVGCERCRASLASFAPPLDVFASFVPVTAPFALKGDIWKELAGGWTGSAHAASVPYDEPARTLPASPYGAAAAGGMGGGADVSAAPVAHGDGDSTRNRILLFAAAAAGMLIFAFAGGAIIAGGFGGDGGTADDETPTASRTAGTTTPGDIETPTPEETDTPEATETAEPTEAPASPTTEPAPIDTATAAPEPATETPLAVPPTATATRPPLIALPSATPTTPALIPGLP